MLGLQIDTSILYYGSDPGYLVWLEGLVDRINATRKAQQNRAEREMNK